MGTPRHLPAFPPPSGPEPLLPPRAPQVAEKERLAVLGLVTAGVVHELASPLSVVTSGLGMAVARLAEAAAGGRGVAHEQVPDLLELLREALDGSERIRAIAGELRGLARADAGPAVPVALERVVERAVVLTRAETFSRAQVVRDLRAPPPVRGREPRLVQVLVNLLNNAAQAIPPGQRARHRIVIRAFPWQGGAVALEVADTGCGIPEAHLARLGEPFFTTKPGSGTGLGLSLCRRIVVEEHGGELAVESVEGLGTTVRVVLPAAAPARAGGATDAPPRGSRGV